MAIEPKLSYVVETQRYTIVAQVHIDEKLFLTVMDKESGRILYEKMDIDESIEKLFENPKSMVLKRF